ncbi:jg11060 [Pararge aegeria aegeria]|uniref:Jg11060 protein n=1 Tax=Pararge aegeria aegeria TaxID=348720 RepID=A0A8S4R578_9NEOP|nr:jg11060 [Pararge aegeria aegeria]
MYTDERLAAITPFGKLMCSLWCNALAQKIPIHSSFEGTHIVDTGDNGRWKGIPDPCGACIKNEDAKRFVRVYGIHVGMQILTVPRSPMRKYLEETGMPKSSPHSS